MSKHGKRNRGLVKRGNGVSQKPEIVFAAFVMKEGDRLVAVGAMDGSGEVDLSGVTTIRPDEAQEGEFIVGVVPRNKLAPVHVVASAVQVVPWTAFKESEPGKSIVEYIASKPTGELTPKYKSFLGTKNKATDIIVHDGNTYLKGFLSTGASVSYSHVKTFTQDFRNANKGVEIRYRDGNDFTLLVKKPYDAKGKHPVLDCDGWKALLGGLRVFELAKMSGVTYSDVQEVANAEGIPCWSPISLIDRDEAERLLKVLAGKNNEAVKEKRENKRMRLRELDQVLHEENDKKLKEHLQTAKEVGKHGWKDLPVTEKTKPMVTPELLKAIDESAEKSGLFAIPQNQVQETAEVDSVAEERCWDKDELDFLRSFESYVLQCGFKYDIADLVRLHTSVKCFMCTLLAGEPGTGKSSLAELYMRALAGKEGAKEEPFKVFVNPAWMEPADLLGYENRHENGGLDFVPAANHFVDYIREPIPSDKVRIVCFEEINLACVEHYFSDFVQIISQRGGKISGCRKDEKDLQVSEDLRIVGTLNSDETTRALSPRFLNRCNSIELECQDEMVKQMLHDAAEGRETPAPKPFPMTQRQITNNDFHKWRKYAEKRCANYEDGYKKNVVGVLDRLVEKNEGCESLLSAAGLSLAGRMVADLFVYVRNRPPYKGDKEGFCSEDDRQIMALDEFLAQRLFYSASPTPGTIDGIKNLIETLKRHGLNRSSKALSKKVNEFKALTGML